MKNNISATVLSDEDITKLNDNIKFMEKKLEIANRNLMEQKSITTNK
jgi:hypothetical protein